MNPYEIVRKFENEVASYAGAMFAIAVDSCSMALFLCCEYLKVKEVTIPRHTYPSVPCGIIHAGGTVSWSMKTWEGTYALSPYPIIDGALRFKRGMYKPGTYHCLSFHMKKHLPIGRGGMILTDDTNADEWFRRARFDGRNEKPLMEDTFEQLGWNCYMTPEQAARGLELFNLIKDQDLPDLVQTYPDLSKFPVYGVR